LSKEKISERFGVTAVVLMMAGALTACAGTEYLNSAQASVSTEQSTAQQERLVSDTISLAEEEEGAKMLNYDFAVFTNVELTGIELSDLSEEQLAVLYQQARYCQAMTEADIDTMDEIVSDDSVFTHMSGMQQTKEEYFADVEDGSLRYFTIGIENPVVEVNGSLATVTYISILNADAYGARGTYRMGGAHWFENRDGVWHSINNPEH